MLPRDFVLWIKGFNARIQSQHEIARRQAYFTVAPHLSKPMPMQQFFREYWPLPGDGEIDGGRQERLINKLKALKEKHGNGRT